MWPTWTAPRQPDQGGRTEGSPDPNANPDPNPNPHHNPNPNPTYPNPH